MNKHWFRKHAGLLAGLVAILAVAVQFSWVSATTATGPVPATTNAVTLAASPVDSLTDGATITYSVTTSSSTKLIGNLTAHLCQHGFTSYTSGSFGYDGSQGSRCVYQPGIVSGGLTSADYEATNGPYSGSVSQTDQLQFHAGTGALVWGNSGGFGPFSLTCDSAHPCDLVLQVNLSGDSVATTYFIQPLSYAGGAVTTTTSSTTSSTTTSSTTSSSTTTTTKAPVTTTTTKTPVTTTTTQVPVTTTSTTQAPVTTTTTINPNGSVDPSTVAPNGTITVTSTGWKADADVAVTLHSAPVTLGSLTADGDGKVQGQFTIPAGTPDGVHTVELTGADPSNTARTVDLSVTVSSTTATTTTLLPAGGSTGTPTSPIASTGGTSLAFTGSSSRTIASIALLLIAAGLFLLGQLERRRAAETL